MSEFHKLSIKNINRETQDAISILFDVPVSLKDTFTFIPGQYITIKTSIDGNEVRRAYSICSASQSTELRVAVKEVAKGKFSVYANTKLKNGDVLEVHPPEGKFIINTSPNANNTYAAFVAGSGITPVMSMIKTVLEEEPKSKFILVYGNKTKEDTIFYDELTTLQETYSNRLFVEFVFSRTQEKDAQFGRIEQSTVNYFVKNKYKEFTMNDYFLCGPEEMINAVTNTLVENGVSKSNINYELFTTSDSPSEVTTALEGQSNITILVDDEEFTFAMDQKKTILDAALEQDIDAPYSCQGGVCSSCICKVTDGSAVMDKNAILTDGELAEGLVLACQAHPTSSTITINFDDV